MTEQKKRLSVVVIGPMDSTDPGRGVPIRDHLPNITKAIETCNDALAGNGLNIRLVPISASDMRAGDINDFAMLSIDQADLAIADISKRSPNTFYELSMLHALGRPTIIVDYKDQLGDLPFYLRRQRVVGVEDFSIDLLTPQLLEAIMGFASVENFEALRTNPIEQFYGSPLVDASAASGIATGYFFNFARRIVQNDYGLISRLHRQNKKDTRNTRALCVVLPTNLRSSDRDRQIIEALPGYKRGREYSDREFVRPMVFATAGPQSGPYIIDYATPLLSTTVSTSYVRLRKLLNSFPNRDFVDGEKFEDRMISAFRETLQRLVEETPGMNPELLTFARPEELRQELESA